MSALEVLLAIGGAAAATSAAATLAWWLLRPRFDLLVRQAIRGELSSARELAERNRGRIEALESSVGAIQEGLAWSGRLLDQLARAVEHLGRHRADDDPQDPQEPWHERMNRYGP